MAKNRKEHFGVPKKVRIGKSAKIPNDLYRVRILSTDTIEVMHIYSNGKYNFLCTGKEDEKCIFEGAFENNSTGTIKCICSSIWLQNHQECADDYTLGEFIILQELYG
ncbi:MAG: hypothetical protein LBL91_01095 [Lachnospiraceae bacterium]|nr:hypothetical protein [Lachnospiraceae bacterium]